MEKYLFSIFDKNGLNVDNMVVSVKVKKRETINLKNLSDNLHKEFKNRIDEMYGSRLVRIDNLREWVVDSKDLK